MREAVGGDRASGVVTNYYTNPSVETTSGTTIWRTNLALNPVLGADVTNIQGVGSASTTIAWDNTTTHIYGYSAKRAGDGTNSPGMKFAIAGANSYPVGTIISWSAWVKTDAAGGSFVPYWENGSPSYNGGGGGSSVALTTANTWYQMSGSMTVSNASASGYGFGGFLSTSNLTASLWIAEGIVEVGNVGPFFYGATTPYLDYTHAWSGTANASASVQKLPNFVGSAWGFATNTYDSAYGQMSMGSGKVMVLRKGAGYSYANPGGVTGLKPSTTYTVVADVYSPTATKINYCDRSNGYANKQFAITPGIWQTLRRQITTNPTGGAYADFGWEQSDATPGTLVYFDNFMLTDGIYNGPYIDGASYGCAWTGTANASTSRGYVPSPKLVTNLITRPQATSSWQSSSSGGQTSTNTYITSGGPNNAPYLRRAYTATSTIGAGFDFTYLSYVQPVGVSVNSGSIACMPGKTYNVSIWVRSNRSQMIRVQAQFLTGSTGGSQTSGVDTTLVPDTWTRLSVVATAAATDYALRLDVDSGTTPLQWAAGDTLDVASAQITLGSSLYNYIDGGMPTVQWAGTVNNSLSTGYAS